ncbi:MAG: FAD-dependent oxidoreductase [Candidatus Eremiobacteraeota bacterium]|nr:FAD-dependent oxidoreductase [Candidatus Eremiobacteraeota bacterium]
MQTFDVAVVGAGLVGAAVARELVDAGYRTVVFERNAEPAGTSTRANAGILRSGFDAIPTSLEARLMRRQNARLPQVFDRLRIPYQTIGALVLATAPGEISAFERTVSRAEENGISLIPIDRARLRLLEPGANARAALLAEGEAITDPFEMTRRLLADVPVYYETLVERIEGRKHSALLGLPAAVVGARAVVNCAGRGAESLAADGAFELHMQTCEYVAYAPTEPPQLKRILVRMRTDGERGVEVFPTLYGYLCAGPGRHGLRDLRGDAAHLLPVLSALPPAGAWKGRRPAPAPQDYVIEWSPRVPALLNVVPMRGSVLSTCLGIARHVRDLLIERTIRPRAPQLAVETREFDAARPWWQRGHPPRREVS